MPFQICSRCRKILGCFEDYGSFKLMRMCHICEPKGDCPKAVSGYIYYEEISSALCGCEEEPPKIDHRSEEHWSRHPEL